MDNREHGQFSHGLNYKGKNVLKSLKSLSIMITVTDKSRLKLNLTKPQKSIKLG